MPDPASDLPPPARPDTIIAGRYKTVRVVGRGGMGTVYEAVHTWTGRRVALKTLLPHIADDTKAVERFRREARAGVQGAHPHIVEVLDMGVDDETGTLYLAQEFLVGEDLAARLDRDRTLSLRDAYEALIPAMAALDAAHRAGIVHRDVKPANLFLSRAPGGEVVTKVIDFGIAALADTDAVTRTGAPLGTPQYMAPEQARGARDLDARTDVWSMGAVWFEALTGRRLLEGANYHAVMAKLLTGDAPVLRPHTDALPSGVREAIEGALRVDRAQRHASMGAFARALLDDASVTSEPWLRALSSAHAFPLQTAAPAEPLAPSSPVTLDLPPPSIDAPPPTPADTLAAHETSTVPPRSDPSLERVATPSAPSMPAVSVARTRWPTLAFVGLTLALLGAWFTRTRAPSQSLAQRAPSTVDQPRSLAPSPPIAPPAARLEAPPTIPVVAPAATPSLADASVAATPRRAVRVRSPQVGARSALADHTDHAEINGAPVLEP